MDEHAAPADILGHREHVGADEAREEVVGVGRVGSAVAASAAASKREATRSTIAHSTSSFEATCAYRLGPRISSTRAMSRTLVAA